MKYINYVLFTFLSCFLFISVSQAIVCNYENGNITFECNVDTSSVSCNTDYGMVDRSTSYSLKASDFNKNGNFSCSNVPTIYLDASLENNTSTIYLYDINSKNVCNKAGNGKCWEFGLTSSSGGNSGNSGGSTQNEGTGGESAEFSTDTFCSNEPVKASFRLLGWILVIVKIVIPIIIITMGSIDFAKAVTSSKDDEIRKASKSLVIRIIIGALIFFIPKVIDIVVKIVDGEEVYNSNSQYNEDSDHPFATCTYCLFHPSDDNCGSLFGGK